MAEEEKVSDKVTLLPPKREERRKEVLPETVLMELIEVERARIESTNRKTDNARMSIAASDDSDKRQFEYHMTKLKSDDVHKLRKHALGRNVIYVGGAAIIIAVSVLVWAMFWGNTVQSELAFKLVKTFAIGLGGYGVFSGAISMVKKLVDDGTTNEPEN